MHTTSIRDETDTNNLSFPAFINKCSDIDAEPGQAAAIITGYVIADNWAKYYSSGSLEMKLGNETYLVSNALATTYEAPNAWPVSVWVRYQPDKPDTCTQSTNRIKILSIRQRWELTY